MISERQQNNITPVTHATHEPFMKSTNVLSFAHLVVYLRVRRSRHQLWSRYPGPWGPAAWGRGAVLCRQYWPPYGGPDALLRSCLCCSCWTCCRGVVAPIMANTTVWFTLATDNATVVAPPMANATVVVTPMASARVAPPTDNAIQLCFWQLIQWCWL